MTTTSPDRSTGIPVDPTCTCPTFDGEQARSIACPVHGYPDYPADPGAIDLEMVKLHLAARSPLISDTVELVAAVAALRAHMATLAGALEDAASALESTADWLVDSHLNEVTGPYNATAQGIRYDATLARAVLAATPEAAMERARAVEEALKAARQVCLEGMVAAPGPHFRWPDEYYVVFNKLDVALGKLDALGKEGKN